MLTIAGGILIAVAALLVIGVLFRFTIEHPRVVFGCIGVTITLAILGGICALLYWWLRPMSWSAIEDGLSAVGMLFGVVVVVGLGATCAVAAREEYGIGHRGAAVGYGLFAVASCLTPFAYAFWRPDHLLTYILMMTVGGIPSLGAFAASKQAYSDGKERKEDLLLLVALLLSPLTFAYVIWRVWGRA